MFLMALLGELEISRPNLCENCLRDYFEPLDDYNSYAVTLPTIMFVLQPRS